MCTYHKFDHCNSCANKHKIYVTVVFKEKTSVNKVLWSFQIVVVHETARQIACYCTSHCVVF